MKGARALAGGMLVLVAICAVPAISVAQDAGTTISTTTTTQTTTDPAPTATTPAAPPEGTSSGSTRRTPSKPSESEPAASGGVPDADPSAVASAASAPKAKKSSSASVTMEDFFFSPSSVTVDVGQTVTWKNTGEAPHNATADDGSFSTPNLTTGQTASHLFSKAGTFSYICTIHPNMKGTVRVVSSSTGGGGGNAGASSSGSGQSETSAVASPDAAGDSNTLPMTGLAAGALALVGFALLSSGLGLACWRRAAARLHRSSAR